MPAAGAYPTHRTCLGSVVNGRTLPIACPPVEARSPMSPLRRRAPVAVSAAVTGGRAWLARAREARPPRRVVAEVALVLGACLLLAILVTWPLVLHLGTDTPGGGSGGDRSGYVWDVWFNAEHGLRLWGTTTQEQIGAPFGRILPASVNTLQLAFLGPAWVISWFTGPVAALNLSLLIGMTLGPAAMYLLIRWLGLGTAAAIWAGIAFAVFPNALIRASAHYPLAFLACFPLLLLALWRWMERPGRRRAVWLALAVAFCWLSNPYYGAMAFVILVTGGIVAVVMLWRSVGARSMLARVAEVAVAIVVLVLIPLAALFWSARGAVEDTLSRSRAELEIYGARITDYLLPDAGNEVFRGVFGDADWASIGAPGGERDDFVGYGTILLAVIAVVWAVRHRHALPPRLRLVMVSAGPLLAALVWFSLATPTRWFGVRAPTPSGLIFDVAPFLRVYARFAVAVTAVLICVAAIGLAALVRRRGPGVAAAVVGVMIAVALLELPPGGGLPLQSAPPILLGGQTPANVPAWAWLRDEAPRDAVVWNFPADPNEGVERFFMYGQLVHGLSISNGDPQLVGIGSDMTSSVPDPSQPDAAVRLATLGVDYVTIEPELYGLVGRPSPDPQTPPAGFTPVVVFPNGSAVWKVTAQPADAVAIYQRSTWWPPERVGGRQWRYMRETAGMTVWAPRAGRYRVAFGLASRPATTARTLVVEGPGGLRRSLPARGADVSFEAVLAQGRNDFTLTNDGPPARQISPADPRVVSLRVSEWALTFRGEGT